MDLVLFEDAMKHIARIVRVVMNSGGHALLGERWHLRLLPVYPFCTSLFLNYLTLFPSLCQSLSLSHFLSFSSSLYPSLFSLFFSLSLYLSLFLSLHELLTLLYSYLNSCSYPSASFLFSFFSGRGWQWQTVTVPIGSLYMRVSSYAGSNLQYVRYK